MNPASGLRVRGGELHSPGRPFLAPNQALPLDPPVSGPAAPARLPQEKMRDIYWLLRVCVRTVEHSDQTGPLFAFMPEFYLSVAINSYSALKNYFGPVHSMEELPGEGPAQCPAAHSRVGGAEPCPVPAALPGPRRKLTKWSAGWAHLSPPSAAVAQEPAGLSPFHPVAGHGAWAVCWGLGGPGQVWQLLPGPGCGLASPLPCSS